MDVTAMRFVSAAFGLALVALAATTPAQTALAETAHDEGDPWCDDLLPGEAGGVTCALPGGDTTTLYFSYAETDAPDVWSLTVRQFGHEGDVLAESDPITVEWVTTAPQPRDVTADGIAEVFVPVLSGMVNVTWSVWSEGGDGIYAPVGQLEGSSVEGLEVSDGLIVGTARSNAAVYIETGSRVTTTGIEDVYILSVDYSARTCTAVALGDLAAVGLTEAGLITDCEARDWE